MSSDFFQLLLSKNSIDMSPCEIYENEKNDMYMYMGMCIYIWIFIIPFTTLKRSTFI